jgi:hypothetical protein
MSRERTTRLFSTIQGTSPGNMTHYSEKPIFRDGRHVFLKYVSQYPYRVAFVFYGFVFLLRIFVSLNQPHPNYYWHNDSIFYWGVAQALVSGKSYPTMYHIPFGLPIVLTPFVAFNISPFFFVWFVQSLMGALTTYLFYRIARHRLDEILSLLCALCFALYLPMLNLSRQLLTETLYIFVISLGFACLLCKNRLLWIVAGMSFGWGAITRWPGVGICFFLILALGFLKEWNKMYRVASGDSVQNFSHFGLGG